MAAGLFLTSLAASASIGAVPGNIDFGQVEPGEIVQQEIYIRTNVGSNFTVSPRSISDTSSNVFEVDRDYSISEQGSSDWFTLESTNINPDTTETIELDEGRSTRVDGEFMLTLEVPEDAEPGLHFGRISLNADIDGDGEGAGTVNFGESTIGYSMDVEGQAERDISAQDVRAFRLDENEAAVEVLLNNEGSVTTSTEGFELEILDELGDVVVTLDAASAKLSPGESQWVEASWSDEDEIEQGSYQIDGEVDYLTGSAYASGSFSLPDFDVVEVRPDDSPGADEDGRESLPLWLVVMILVVMGVLMYSFDIDPFWILLILGVLGVSAFILLSGVSNYLLVLLLMLVGIILYGGM